MEKVLIVGKTGPIGQEFQRRLNDHDVLREAHYDFDWRSASVEERRQALLDCSAVITATPRRQTYNLIEELISYNPDLCLYDCSGSQKGHEGWEYALPELNSNVRGGINRFIGPGCFATAASLALWPVRDHLDPEKPIHIEAIGGASTGGKKWVARFEETPGMDICVPNAGLNHPHIAEIKKNLGLDRVEVRMVPQLARRYRGTTMAIHGSLNYSIELSYVSLIPDWERVVAMERVPKWGEVVQTDQVHVHWVQEGRQFTIHVAFDNLGKGSVGQALQSLSIALG